MWLGSGGYGALKPDAPGSIPLWFARSLGCQLTPVPLNLGRLSEEIQIDLENILPHAACISPAKCHMYLQTFHMQLHHCTMYFSAMKILVLVETKQFF